MQEHGPFLYVLALGTRPHIQGQGKGTALLRHMCREADRQNMCEWGPV